MQLERKMQDEQFDATLEQDSKQNIESPSTNLSQENAYTTSEAVYGKEFKQHLLEQYKMYVEMADRISSRRVQIGSFYTSILSALLALLSITGNKELFQGPQSFVLLTVSILGLCLCLAWIANINSYKQLNSLKFRVIHEMEAYLPFACYDREWQILKEDKNRRKYIRLTAIEQYIPIIIAVPYFFLLIYSFMKMLGQ